MRLLGRDLAMDLGAASTRIYVKRKGIVLDEPSVVMCDDRTGKIVGYGAEAADETGGRTHWPVSGGLPADAELARRMIRHFLRKVHWHPYARPRLVMALPPDSTAIDREALQDIAYEADARIVHLVPHALAAALGAGMSRGGHTGHMVIDIGRDAARIAVLSGESVVATGSVPYGGQAVNRAIVRFVEREHGLQLDDREAEAAKRHAHDGEVMVRARDPETGRERQLTLPVQHIFEATGQPVESIARAAMETVERCPAELAADLGECGAVLIGGGALLRGIGRRLRETLCMPVRRAERPLECVALGLGRCVDELGLIGRLRGGRT
ncbi:rod shape-determining protein [Nonomuraea gerenzanensis]|nr:rod shape-determining protein [Nonomuraea gerenzanensis]UBU11751.1 rod shape-determining protein [Nonomuraea gerenzanensis]